MGNFTSAVPKCGDDLNFYTTGQQVADLFEKECNGKVILITGANTGLGLETARVLASKGAKVTIACRTPSKGQDAVASILKQHPTAEVTFMQLDLASFSSIQLFADLYAAKFHKLDILINNAGVMACPKSLTNDGIETQFGVNHLGHFYLTKLLLPTLLKSGTEEYPARVVNVASLAQYIYAPDEGIFFDDINGDKSYHEWERYGQSKLANVLFAKELNRRYQSQHVVSVSLHPGSIPTSELLRFTGVVSGFRGIVGLRWGAMARVAREGMKSIAQGVATSVTCAIRPDIVSGAYYTNCQVCDELHPKALDQDIALKLWDFSEELVKNIESKLTTSTYTLPIKYCRKQRIHNCQKSLDIPCIYAAPMQNMWLDELTDVLKYPIALAHCAIVRGSIELLEYLVETYALRVANMICICEYGLAMDVAARLGKFEIIKYLHEHGNNAYSRKAMDYAACDGEFEIVEWLHENRNEGCSKSAMDYAAANSHLDVVRCLHDNRSEGCTVFAMDTAGENGHLDTIKWLHENRTEGCTTFAIDNAAKYGHLDIVKWLHDNRTEGCTIYAMDYNAANGHLDIVKWLHENRTEGCTTNAMDKAACGGYIDIVQFIQENLTEGCTVRALENSTWHSHHKVVQYFTHN